MADQVPVPEPLKKKYVHMTCTTHGSNKFYQITVLDNIFTVDYGAIGIGGRTTHQSKTMDSHETAVKEYEKKIREKTAGGYQITSELKKTPNFEPKTIIIKN